MTRTARHAGRLAPVLLLALLPAGCGRGGGAGGGAEWLSSPARPVSLQLTLDAGRSRSRRIGPEGGSVVATGADGTRYQLRVPRDALLSPVEISLTPVTRVSGLPFREQDFRTVQIEPSGLRLMQPATLAFRTRGPAVPAAEQVAFAYDGSGADAHLHPLGPDPERVELQLLHFSGYGFGRAAPNDPGRLALQHAASEEARLTAHIAAEVDRARASDFSMAELTSAVSPALIEYFDHVLEPLMRQAESNEAYAECVVQKLVAWMRQVELLGLDRNDDIARRNAEAQASFRAILENATEKLTKRYFKACWEQHDFSAVQKLLALERQAQLLGINVGRELTLEEVLGCLTFDVEFRSVFENKTPTGGVHEHVAAQLRDFPVAWRILGHESPPSAPLEYVSFSASGNPLRDLGGGNDALGLLRDAEATISAAGTRPDSFRVIDVSWDMNPREEQGTNCRGENEVQKGTVAENFTVVFVPGVPHERVRYRYKRGGQVASIGALAVEAAKGLGGSAPAADVEAMRIPKEAVMDEHYWASDWTRAHRDIEVKLPGLPGSKNEVNVVGGQGVDDDIGYGVYAVQLKPVEAPGVWRADFASENVPWHGFSKSERSYIILRHAPK